MNIKDMVLNCGSFKTNDGIETRFWEDTWVSDRPFKDSYPTIYNIVNNSYDTVAKIMSSMPLNIYFRRALVGDTSEKWEDLVAKITHITLNNERDGFVWRLHKTGQFSVQSMYQFMINQNTQFSHKVI